MLREKSLLLLCCRNEFTSVASLDQQPICKEVLSASIGLLKNAQLIFLEKCVDRICFSE